MVPPVERNAVLWTIVVFFGASIMFATLRNATKGESAGVQLLVQLGAALILVGAIVVYVKRRR
jgi:hypothetical protein